jgi:GAF domain-containing protein
MLGVIYLERDREIFTDECIEIIKLLCEQGAISLENAQLYQNLQQSKIIKKAAQQNRNSCSPKKY